MRTRVPALVCAVTGMLALAGCGQAERAPAPPPADAVLDYQLGGAYPPPPEVTVVARDRAASPVEGLYSICYVNAFQTQPGERDLWADEFVLRDDGHDVVDPEWPDEALLDTSTDERRSAIADLVGEWIRGCAASGFSAVEFDNLDSFTRSDGMLSIDDNLALAQALVDIAHDSGLAAGQKNAAEFADDLHRRAGFDFAVAEECAAYGECSAYERVYGEAVLDIEYTDNLPIPFAEMCTAEHPPTMVLRDRDLTTPDAAEYVFQTCA
jgi:hypothetical protein